MSTSSDLDVYVVLENNQVINEFDFDSIFKAMKATELLHAINDDTHLELLKGDTVVAKFINGHWEK